MSDEITTEMVDNDDLQLEGADEIAKLKEALKKANAEAAERRHGNKELLEKLAAFEANEKKRKESELSELERLKSQLDEVQAEREKALTELQAERLNSRLRLLTTGKIAQGAFEDVQRNLIASGITHDSEDREISETLKSLFDKKPYLAHVEKTQPAKIDARKRGGADKQALADEKAAELRRRYGI